MRIDIAGRVLIGLTAALGDSTISTQKPGDGPHLACRHNGTAAGKLWSAAYIDSTNSFYTLNQTGIGVKLADGATAWAAQSDERLKDIIEPISDARAKVKMLRSVIGKYKTDEAGKRRPFLIAQDLLNALPEVVGYSRLPNSEDETEYMTVEYTNTIPLLVAAFNEQEAELQSLRLRVAELEAR
jgi:hypothetical protein